MPAKENAIFISYRRSDSAYVTGHIHNRLRSHFGQGIVFLDVTSIPLGVDFRKHLKQSVGAAQVLIAVIGDRWLEALQQRAANEAKKDWVREEIEIALALDDMPVIPLLIEKAQMPTREALPIGMQDLVYRNGTQVRAALDFENDVDRLIQGLEEIVGVPDDVLETQTKLASVRSQSKLSAFEQVKLDAFKKRKAILIQRYQAASNQVSGTLSDADKVTIQVQIDGIEQALTQVDNDINELLGK